MFQGMYFIHDYGVAVNKEEEGDGTNRELSSQ
jgi:hypothetical protein